MKKKKYLPLYYKWMETGQMDHTDTSGVTGGLCGSSAHGRLLNMFEPPKDLFHHWWGYEPPFRFDMLPSIQRDFTPLRQTIVLFLAAMNDEL